LYPSRARSSSPSPKSRSASPISLPIPETGCAGLGAAAETTSSTFCRILRTALNKKSRLETMELLLSFL
jgi:hypothetical protein